MEEGIQAESFCITGSQLKSDKSCWVTVVASTTLADGERVEVWSKRYLLPTINLAGGDFYHEMRDVLVALVEAL